MEVTVVAPNHGGDSLGSSMGPMGPIGSKKWFKSVKNYHAPKFEFSTTPRSEIFPKKWKLRLWRQIKVGTLWGPSWGQWGPIGSKIWVKPQKITMSQNSNFRLPCDHRFFPKNWSYGYGDKSWWGPPRVNLDANGVPMGKKKWFKSVENYHAPKFEFSTTPWSSIFPKKWNLRLWRQIT